MDNCNRCEMSTPMSYTEVEYELDKIKDLIIDADATSMDNMDEYDRLWDIVFKACADLSEKFNDETNIVWDYFMDPLNDDEAELYWQLVQNYNEVV